MGVSKEKVVIEIETDVKGAQGDVGSFEKSMKKVTASAKDAADATDGIGKAAGDASRGFKKVGTEGGKGFKILGAAWKATGIGLLISLVTALVAKFMENKKVADALAITSAALGGAMDLILEPAKWLFNNLLEVFANPQKAVNDFKNGLKRLGEWFQSLGNYIKQTFIYTIQLMQEKLLQARIAWNEWTLDYDEADELRGRLRELRREMNGTVDAMRDAAEEVAEPFVLAYEAAVEWVEEIKEGATAAANTRREIIRLRDAQRELDVEVANSTAKLENLKKIRDDERLSIQERIAAAEEAASMEQALTNKRVKLANDLVSALEKEIRIQGETEENLQELADARIQAADAAAQSATIQTELMTSIYGLNQEAMEIEREIAAMRREFTNERLEGLEAEKAAIEDEYIQRQEAIEQLKTDEETKTQLLLEAKASRDKALEDAELAHQLELDAISDEADAAEDARRKQERDDELALMDQRIEWTKSGLQAIMALNEAFSKDDQQSAEKAFKRNKALALATAVVNTGQAVVNALTAGGNPIKLATGAQFVEAGIAAAVGAAQIATIAKSKFGGGSSGDYGGGAGGGGGRGGGGSIQPPQLDLSFLGDGAGQTGAIQAYVISEDVTNAQQANQKIQEQSTL